MKQSLPLSLPPRGMQASPAPSCEFYAHDLLQSYAKRPLPSTPSPAPAAPSSLPLRITRKPVGSGLKRQRLSPKSKRRIPRFPELCIPPTTSCQSGWMSYGSPLTTGHRSPMKIKQVLGHDVSVFDDRTLCRAMGRAAAQGEPELFQDSSSDYSGDFESSSLNEHSLPLQLADGIEVPSLESDTDGHSSCHDSWAPSSPQVLGFSPMDCATPTIRNSHDGRARTFTPGSHSSFQDTPPTREADRSSRFSDVKVAGKYHSITAELASPCEERTPVFAPPRQPRAWDLQSQPLGLAAIKKLKKRTPSSTDFIPSFDVGDRPRRTPFPRQTSEALVSVFDPDSSDEEEELGHRGRDSIREWFARKNDEHRWSSRSPSRIREVVNSGDEALEHPQGRLSRAGGHVKGLFADAAGRTKNMRASKQERRKEELRKNIKVLSGGQVF